MYYGAIKNNDIADGIGVRVSLFVSGCTNRCKNCFQPETWAFDYGEPFTEETEEKILEMLRPAYIKGLTVLGGDPFEPSNQRALLPFLKRVKAAYPNKGIWCFTGYRYEDELMTEGVHPHCEVTEEMLSLISVLVDGRFEEDKKDIRLIFRGSSNQRLIDLDATRASGELVLWQEAQAKN